MYAYNTCQIFVGNPLNGDNLDAKMKKMEQNVHGMVQKILLAFSKKQVLIIWHLLKVSNAFL